MKSLITLLLLCITSSLFAYEAKLSDEELARLRFGEEILRVEELKGEVFPRVTVINVISHTPKQNMDIFSDFENHKNFIPGLVKSKIVNKVGNATDVSFEMHMPAPISNSSYITRNTITQDGPNYKLVWDLVKSKQLKATKGMMVFEEFGNRTLFTYTSHITPESSFAWTVKSRVVPDVKKNVEVLIKHLEKTAGKSL